MEITDFINNFNTEVEKVKLGLFHRKIDSEKHLPEDELIKRKSAEQVVLKVLVDNLLPNIKSLETVPDEKNFQKCCTEIIDDKDIHFPIKYDALGTLCEYSDKIKELLDLLCQCHRNAFASAQTTVYDYFDRSCFDPSLEAILAPTEGTEGKVVILPPRGPQPS